MTFSCHDIVLSALWGSLPAYVSIAETHILYDLEREGVSACWASLSVEPFMVLLLIGRFHEMG